MKYTAIPDDAESQRLMDEKGSPLLVQHNVHRQFLEKPSILVTVTIFVLSQVFWLAVFLFTFRTSCRDPTLALWSPANEAVRYKTVTFEPHFFHRSPYVGEDIERVDPLWLDLYDFGTSGLSKSEADQLLNATLPAPRDSESYLVELSVFHDLHCLNLIRKAVYPDQYPEMYEEKADGTVDHLSKPSFHIDHCIDSLRQSLMCTADVTPVRFHHNSNDDYHVFPDIYATHTCRDWDAIVDWARGRQAPAWMLDFGNEQHVERP